MFVIEIIEINYGDWMVGRGEVTNVGTTLQPSI